MSFLARTRASADYLPVLVAVEDVFWLTVLIPLCAVFQAVLLLAHGYYAARRKGPLWATGYTVAVLLALRVLSRLSSRRRGRTSS